MHSPFHAPSGSTKSRRLRLARGYFLAMGILVASFLGFFLIRVLTDETLHRAEVLIMNANVLVTGVVVPILLFVAARLLGRRRRSGALVGGVAFAWLMLGLSTGAPGGLITVVIGLIGIALALRAWRGITPPRGEPRHLRAG